MRTRRTHDIHVVARPLSAATVVALIFSHASSPPAALAQSQDAAEPSAALPPEPAERAEAPTRVAVTSPMLLATVVVDGGPARNLPATIDVAPGKHEITVRAPGYLEESREIVVPKGRTYPLDVPLDPEPAKLALSAPPGATVHVDGKRVGTAPLAKPVDLDPGKHFVSVTKTGFVAHAQEVVLERGKKTSVSVDLQATRQRYVSWVLIGAGGAGIATGITLGVLSVIDHRAARDIDRSADGRELTPEAQRQYDVAISRRDDFRTASGVAGGVGLGLFLVGGTLLVFDTPRVPSPAGAARKGDVSAVPLVGPRPGGAEWTLRF